MPKILVGNRLHLAFRRQISEASAEIYAEKNNMAFFEVSPLCDFNVTESFAELSRLALKRNGMSRVLGFNKGEYNCPKNNNTFKTALTLMVYFERTYLFSFHEKKNS